ncbi:MAG: hypothetical protein JNM51_11275 [Bacteroidia bacterium]|nr:hypothetical protein [Bacteroidia bacterium]
MKNIHITNHAELMLRIMQLKSEKLSQETELKHSAKEFIYSISPVSIVKDSLHELAQDEDVKFDMTKVGLNIGANFLIDKIVGRNRSIKGFLGAMLIEKLSSKFINNNTSSIISGIGRLISAKKK